MTTPTKAETHEKAVELYFKHERDRYITPEQEELRESGFERDARNSLMRNEERSQVLNYLEKMASEQGFHLCKTKTEYSNDLEDYPINDIMKYGCFATGGRGSGKTNLVKLIVAEAIRAKVMVKVFDPSLAWKTFPLPKIRVRVRKGKDNGRLGEICEWNRIYDISRLSVLTARDFVSEVLQNDLTEAIHLTDISESPKCLVVLEEAQNIIPSHSLRSNKYLEISRFITQSRNFNMSFVAVTQRLSSVDVNLPEIAGVRYWMKLEGHRNLVKARYWLDKYTAWRLRDLEVGTTYLQVGSKVKLLRLPLFKTKPEILVTT